MGAMSVFGIAIRAFAGRCIRAYIRAYMQYIYHDVLSAIAVHAQLGTRGTH